MDQSTKPSSLAVWAGLGTIYLVWGSTYLGIAVAVESMPPFLMASARFLLAGLLLATWVVLRHRSDIRRLTRTELRDALIVGALLAGVGNGFVSWGEQSVPSGITALMVALTPAWLAVIGRAWLGDRLPVTVVAGIGLGLVGVAFLSWPAGGPAGSLDPAGLAAVLAAPVGWSLGSAYAARRARLPAPPMLSTALQMLLGGVVLAVFGAVSGEFAQLEPAAFSGASWLAFVYLTLVGSLLAWTVYAWLLRVAPLPKISTYAYVNPVVAVVLGTIVLDEPIGPRTIVGATIIVAGVALIVTARSRGPRQAEARPRAAERLAGEPVVAGAGASPLPEP